MLHRGSRGLRCGLCQPAKPDFQTLAVAYHCNAPPECLGRSKDAQSACTNQEGLDQRQTRESSGCLESRQRMRVWSRQCTQLILLGKLGLSTGICQIVSPETRVCCTAGVPPGCLEGLDFWDFFAPATLLEGQVHCYTSLTMATAGNHPHVVALLAGMSRSMPPLFAAVFL